MAGPGEGTGQSDEFTPNPWELTVTKRTRKTSSKTTPARAAKTPAVREAPADPHRLAAVFLRLRELCVSPKSSLRYWRSQWWDWVGTHYRPLDQADLRGQLTAAIKREFNRIDGLRQTAGDEEEGDEKKYVLQVNRSLVSNVLQALQGTRLVRGDHEQPQWLPPVTGRHRSYVAMLNGLVDLDGLVKGEPSTVLPHTSDWFSPVCLPYPYDPDARCPGWEHFVSEAMEGDQDRVDLAQEWFGFNSTHDTAMEKFLMCFGEGGTSKSVFLKVLIAMLGRANVSHVPLELFGDKFQLYQTLGKLANIVPEIGEGSRLAEGIFKNFVSGERMFFDVKNLPGVNAYPTARLSFAANNLPRFHDRSNAIPRRILLLPFRVLVPLEQQDPQLAESFTAELPGIFNWAVAGLRRLRHQGRFTEPAICREALDAYRTDSNPARAFLQEHVCRHDGQVQCSAVYGRYTEWCPTHGYKPLDERLFGKEVARYFPGAERKRGPKGHDGKRPWTYMGLALRGASGAPTPHGPVVRPPVPKKGRVSDLS